MYIYGLREMIFFGLVWLVLFRGKMWFGCFFFLLFSATRTWQHPDAGNHFMSMYICMRHFDFSSTYTKNALF